MSRLCQPKITITVASQPLQRTLVHRFLKFTRNERNRGTAQINAFANVTKGPRCAAEKLAHTKQGSQFHAFLQLHNALVVSRICYATYYLKASKTQHLRWQRFQRAGLKNALGVSRTTDTRELYSEVVTVPITCISIDRAIGQMERLHLTELTRGIITRIETRTGTSAPTLYRKHYISPLISPLRQGLNGPRCLFGCTPTSRV